MERILANALGHEPTEAAVAEKRDLLERLLARLAHEIRNPLSSLNIHVQLLEEDLGTLAPALREQLTSRLEIIHGEVHRLESIVDHFLKLAGPSALDLESIDLLKVIGHVCELLRPEAAARQIEIITRVDRPVPHILADSVRLTQALMNMVINAMQAIEREGRIEVRVEPLEGALLVRVADNGAGIPAERLAAIFDPYFTTKPEGSGLGLWIAQKIVIAHGGSLKAENAPGGGAVFTMRLPLKPPPG